MSWITWVAILVAWPLVGLGVAYLFGRFTHGAEMAGNAGELAPPVVSYLRRGRGTRAPSRATTQAKARRHVVGGRRPH